MRRVKSRRNPRKSTGSYKVHRPVVISSGGLFYRPKFKHGPKAGEVSSKLFTKSTRLNPFRRRKARRNPAAALRSAFSTRNLLFLTSIGGGVMAGFLGIPLIDRFMPQAIRDQRKWAYGALYILAGSMLASMVKKPALKTASLTLAGMGVYDIIQQNLLPDMPLISTSNLLVERMLPAGTTSVEAASANYMPMLAANYAPQGGTYTALAANYEPMGNDDPYTGIFQ